MSSHGLHPMRVKGGNRMIAGCFAMAALATAACTSGHERTDDATLRATRGTERQPTPPCEGRLAAKLILLEVDGMDEPAAQRVEAVLAERIGRGIISTRAEPSTRMLTILTKADSDITAATAMDIVGTLGLDAHEASEDAYDQAVAELGSRVLSIPTTDRESVLANGRDAHSTLQSLEDSLIPLKTRFNDSKGKPRFIALLSPT